MKKNKSLYRRPEAATVREFYGISREREKQLLEHLQVIFKRARARNTKLPGILYLSAGLAETHEEELYLAATIGFNYK
jgi:hypothetical protein